MHSIKKSRLQKSEASPELQALYLRRDRCFEQEVTAEEEATEAMCHQEEVSIHIEEHQQQHSALLQQEQGRYTSHGEEAAHAQRTHRDLSRQLKEAQSEARKSTSRYEASKRASKVAENALDSAKGPFLTRVDEVLNSLHLKRCAYHGGALTGNDVHKVFHRANYSKLVSALKPR